MYTAVQKRVKLSEIKCNEILSDKNEIKFNLI